MISRTELERLIVLGLSELRQAEADLANRFSSGSFGRLSFATSLANLKVQAGRLEALLGALDNHERGSNPLAA